VSSATFIARKPVRDHLVQVPIGMVATAPVLSGAPLVRADPGRIPDRRPQGAPPPASTFYPTTSRPAATSPGGMVRLPGGNQAVAVPPASRSRTAGDSLAKPLQVAPPSAVPPAVGGRNVAAPSPGGLLSPVQPPAAPAMRQPPSSAAPATNASPGGLLAPMPQQRQASPPPAAAPAAVAVPTTRVDNRGQNRAPQSSLIGPVPPPTSVVPAAPNVARPVTRPQPVTPTAAPAPAQIQVPIQVPAARQAPAAPTAPVTASPGMPQAVAPAAQGAPAAPVAPASAPGSGRIVRER
jgi:hypothetical protein